MMLKIVTENPKLKDNRNYWTKYFYCGDPQQLGINDITEPAYGVYYPIAEDEVPVFWACGVTPQLCAQHNKINLMITHKPGHMLICDLENQSLYKKKTL